MSEKSKYVYAAGTPDAEFKSEIITQSGVTGFDIYQDEGVEKISINEEKYNEVLQYIQKEVETSLLESKGLKTDTEIVKDFFEKTDGNKQQGMIQKIRKKLAKSNDIIPGSIKTTLPYETRETIINTLKEGNGITNQEQLSRELKVNVYQFMRFRKALEKLDKKVLGALGLSIQQVSLQTQQNIKKTLEINPKNTIDSIEKELGEEFRPVTGTANGYYVSNLGRVCGPRGIILSPKDNQGHNVVTITLRDNDGDKNKRTNQLVQMLVVTTFPELITCIGGVMKFKNPKIDHINGDKRNNAAANLQIIDYRIPNNLNDNMYTNEKQQIKKLLQQDHTRSNVSIAQKVFGQKYKQNPKQYDQLVYRIRKELEGAGEIAVSQHKKAKQTLQEANEEILTLIKAGELTGKEIAKKLGVSETAVSRRKEKTPPLP